MTGEEIAKNTANQKVGVIGGISFLGQKGIVKPVSSESYLDSIKAQIAVGANNEAKTIVFTMGNTSLKIAQEYYSLDSECFIEIGNFIFDSIASLQDFQLDKMSIVANIGKLSKIGQGKKIPILDLEMLILS
ncbi:MAG: cobalt-precorrin-5B (C(1))-methyltransferase [Bacillus subtilis]|nr:cobalt-precorrin-5B (C(1))-methyltransferase [Bacillus subtilis]